MAVKVCVYAICKNEAKEAADWYANVKDADHVVVLDTGSTDGTQDILRDLGCPLHEAELDPFRFDVARNACLDIAMSETDVDVFLTTDFDERLSDGWHAQIVENWDPQIHTRGVYDNYHNGSPLAGSLNWLHDRSWMWKYPCHEVLERRDGTGIFYDVKNELDLRKGKVALRHEQDLTKGTRRQYLDLLRWRYYEYHDVESAAYFLRELMYRNMPHEALDHEDKVLELPLSGNPGAWVLICLAWAHETLDVDLDVAEAMLFRAYLMDPGNRTAPTKLAEMLCAEGSPGLAGRILEQAFETAAEFSDRNLFVDNADVWQWRMADWLGVCRYRTGRWEEALECHMKALAGAPKGGWEEIHIRKNIECSRKMLGGDAE